MADALTEFGFMMMGLAGSAVLFAVLALLLLLTRNRRSRSGGTVGCARARGREAAGEPSVCGPHDR